MKRAPFFARLTLTAVGMLLVGGCKEMPTTHTESEIQDIATDVAQDATSDLASIRDRLTDVEAKAEEVASENESLRSKVGDLESETRALRSELDSVNARVPY